MFVHVRSELANSPEAYLLLDQIRTLWNEADAFVAAVSLGGSPRTRPCRPGRWPMPT